MYNTGGCNVPMISVNAKNDDFWSVNDIPEGFPIQQSSLSLYTDDKVETGTYFKQHSLSIFQKRIFSSLESTPIKQKDEGHY